MSSSTSELDSLRKSVQAFLADHPIDADRAPDDAATVDRSGQWSAVTEQLGVQAITVPEEYGGAGYGFAEQAVVLEEFGRALTPVPYLSSAVVATQVLLRAGSDDARAAWLPKLASGEVTATVAALGPDGLWSGVGSTVTTLTRPLVVVRR